MGDLPEGWLRAKLSDVIEPRGEKALPSELPDMPFLGMDQVEAQTTRILGSVPASSMKSSAARFFAGDVLYGRLRPYLNKVAQPNFHGLASAEFIVFPDTELLHSKFLRFRLNAADFVRFASHLNEGDRPRVSFDQIGDFELCLPPSAEQNRIVAKIEELFSELDQGVASLKTARAQLKVYRQSLLKNAFSGKLTAKWRAAHRDQLETAAALQQRIARERAARYQQQLAAWQAAGQAGPKPKPPKPLPPLTPEELADLPELPEGWGWVKLGALIDEPAYGTSKKCDYETAGVGVLRIPNVVSGKVDAADLKFAQFSQEEIAAYQLSAGDLLMIRSNGSVSIVGKCALISPLDTTYLYAGYLIRLRPLQTLAVPAYLAQLLSSHELRKQIEYKAKSTSGVNNINSGEIQSLVVPFCIQSEQEQILQELESKLSEADQLDQTLATALQQAEALRQSILKKAFCGQLVPQDQNDEPAAALLERIRAAQGKAKKNSGIRGRKPKSNMQNLHIALNDPEIPDRSCAGLQE